MSKQNRTPANDGYIAPSLQDIRRLQNFIDNSTVKAQYENFFGELSELLFTLTQINAEARNFCHSNMSDKDKKEHLIMLKAELKRARE